jgi:hypothetical protein
VRGRWPPIIVNERIAGGKHLVVPGVTGEFASAGTFRDTRRVLRELGSYRPRAYFERHWDTSGLFALRGRYHTVALTAAIEARLD